MKLILTIILLCTATLYSQDTHNISLEKNKEGGFDVLQDGKTINKYSKQNSDSTLLSALTEIFNKSTKEGNLSTNVTTIQLPQEDGTDWTTVIVTFLVVVLSYFTARFLYNRQIRAENKRQWLEKVRTEGSEIFDILVRQYLLNKSIKTFGSQFTAVELESNQEYQSIKNKLLNLNNIFSLKYLNFRFLFHLERNESLLVKLEDFYKAKNDDSDDTKPLFKELRKTLHILLNNEQDLLDKGKF
jgi:hypothetical protein